MAEKLTTEECIKRFMHIHGNQYEYVLVCYRGLEKKVIIICRTHGPFWQTPAVHFSSHCPKCALERRSKEQQISKEEFIQRADLLHNFEFDYTDTIIDGVLNIASFLHKPCNKIISQQVRYHLEGYGCKSCYFLGKMLTKEEFETKANIVHNFEFDYTNTIIDGVANKSSYLHKPCGKIVTQTPNSHLEGRGCQYCLFMTKEEFETKANIIHNYEFDYTDTIINGTKNKSNFLHKHCGKISTQRVDRSYCRTRMSALPSKNGIRS